MSVTAQTPWETLTVKKSIANSSVARILRFSADTFVDAVFGTVVIGIYLTI